MAIKTYNDQNFVAIANAIRSKSKNPTTYKPSEMAAAISAIESGFELLPQDTVSGAIANFPDGSNNYPVVELIANIAPKQAGSGDPAPDNVRAISGYNGMKVTRASKNLLSMVNYDGGVYNPDIGRQLDLTLSDTQFTKLGNTYSVNATETWKTFTVIFPLVSGVSYFEKWTISAAEGTVGSSRNYLDENYVVLSRYPSNANPTTVNQQIAPPTGAKYLAITFTNRGTANQTINIIEPQIEIGSSATDFEPYSEEVKSISWESEAGTVYGGTLNVTTGELTVISVRKKISDFGTWSYVTNYDGYFQAPKGDMKEAIDNFTPLDGLYCEVYKTATSSAAGSGKVNYTIASGSGAAAGLRIRNNDYSDVTSFLEAFGDYYIVYPLVTPETYQLEPEEVKTLLGVNNIYADTGDVEVTYRADIDLYIAKKIAEGA